MAKRIFTYFLILFLGSICASAQKNKSGFNAYVDSSTITFYFYAGSSTIDLGIESNSTQLRTLQKIGEKVAQDSLYVPKVLVTSNVSPEGSLEANSEVRWKRLRNSVDLISRYFTLPQYTETYFDAKVTIPQIWKNLAVMVKRTDWPNKQKVVSILESGGDIPAKLKALEPDHKTWKAISTQFFPKLRSCKVVVYFKKKKPRPVFPSSDIHLSEQTTIKVSEPTVKPKVEQPVKKVEPKPKKPRTRTTYTPILAVNTNLLYDVAITPNISIEVPVKDKLSFSLMGLTSWWLKKDDSWCYQFQYAELEGKRWLGDRSGRDVMTGHALGLYAGIGYYDMESHSQGYQGEVNINAGVSYHYAKAFGNADRWRFQFGFGLGVTRLNYSYYEGRQNNKYLVWQYDGKKIMVLPTKLELTLGYLIHKKKVVTIEEKGGEEDDK